MSPWPYTLLSARGGDGLSEAEVCLLPALGDARARR